MRRSGTWTRPFLAHASIGLCTACAWLQGDRLEIWTHSQGIFTLRAQIARVLDRPLDAVVLHHVAGAGCYGHNGADDVALDAAPDGARETRHADSRAMVARRRTGQCAVRGADGGALEATLDAGMRIASWATRVVSPSHATRPGMHGEVNLLAAAALDEHWVPRTVADAPEASGGGATRNARPLYGVGSRSLAVSLVESPVRTSALRSLGAHANVFAIEGMMEELAAAAHVDAGLFRRRHLSDPRAVAVLDRVLTMSAWSARTSSDAGTALGLGLARYKGRGAYCAVVVDIELDVAVHVRRVWCAVDVGRIVNPDGARNQIEGRHFAINELGAV